MPLQQTVQMLLMWIKNSIAMDLLTGFALVLLAMEHLLSPATSLVADLIGGFTGGLVLTGIAMLAGIGFGLRGLAELGSAVGMN